MSALMSVSIKHLIEQYFQEDDLSRNIYYINSLPSDMVTCSLKLKDDLILAGLPIFCEVFNYLKKDVIDYSKLSHFESKKYLKSNKSEINFELPFNIALTGERIALNLLQKTSSIATFTNSFVEKAKSVDIKILDTRKTTPGHRSLEKYGVVVGGGYNHRYGQSDMWMVKDNHKDFFGGVKAAVNFFRNLNGFYTPIEVEVHNISEFNEVVDLGVKHLMLDNFSPEQIREVIGKKPSGVTIEVSGGIRQSNIDSYLIRGIDAISIGALTNGAPNVDISLKYKRK